MKTLRQILLSASILIAFVAGPARGATTIISDNYTVTTSGTGFALNAGINTGINPPTTRLTGSTINNLRYLQTSTARPATCYDINNNRVRVTTGNNVGRYTFSADGTTPFDFGPALGTSFATPANPLSYDVKISLRNDATNNVRLSFGIATLEGDINNMDFAVQEYRVNTGDNFYTLQKRIDQGSYNGVTTTDGTGDLNAVMATTGNGTNLVLVDFLIRVTDAGAESGSAYNSRIQVSINNGSTWIYDTATDAAAFNRFRFDGAARVFVFDQAPNTSGTVYYDGFSATWNSGPHQWTGAGANGNWNNTTNWGGTVPASGDKLIFNGTTRPTNTNDLSGLSVPWVKLNTSGFALWGNSFTVSGAITNVTGTSTINNALTAGGAWRFQSDAGTLTLAGNITNGAQNMIVDGAGNTTSSGIVSGTAGLTKGGAGTLTLSGTAANTLSGNSIVNTGIISLGKTAGVTAIDGNITVGDGAGGAGVDILRLAAANQIADSATVTVSASGNFDLNGFAETVTSVSSSSSAALVSLGAGTLTVGNGSAFTLAGVISGSGNLVKQGTSTMTLSGANTFSGTATISAGVLNVQNATALGGAGATTVSSGAALEIQGGLTISGEGLTLNGTGISSAGALRNISGNNSWSGAVTLASASRINSDSGTLTISGAIGGGQNLTIGGAANTTASGDISGAGSLTKDGAGVATLSGASANTYSGGTVVNAGTLALAKTAGVNAVGGNLTIGDGTGTDTLQLGAANQIPDSAAITISAGGVFDLNGSAETVASVSSASASSQISLGAGTLTTGDANPATFAGAISGTGNIVKQGSGTLTLSGASTFSGTASINAGVVNVQNAAALGSTAGATIVNNGMALEVQGGISISGEPITLNGTGISSAGALRNISGANSSSGAVTLGSDARINSDSGTLTISGGVGGSGNLTIGGAGNTVVSGVIATGTGSLTKDGIGIATLSGANTYSGNTTINAGTLALGVGGSIGNSPSITIANGTTLDVSAVSFSVGSSQTLVRNSTSGNGSVNGSLTLASGAGVSLQANGTIGTLSIAGDLTVNGNVITINVSGSALGAGTNTVISYTGTKTGSFNSTPTITGSGIAAGMLAEIIESAGQISLRVYRNSNRVWSGAGANGNWNTGANWDGVVPISGEKLTFAGTTRQTNTNDLSGLSASSLNFNNGGFALFGNELTISDAITNSGNNTVNGNLAWSSTNPKTWNVASGSELLLANTTTVGVVGDQALVGGGTLRVTGTMNFTNTPPFSVYEGKHILDGGSFISIGGYRVGSQATGAGAQTILTNGASLSITATGGGLRVGDSANPVAARLDLDNSTLTISGGALMSLPYAASAIGIVSQTGGTVTLGIVSFNEGGAGTGTYTVKNGTLIVKQIRKNISGGTSTINFDNAILRTDSGANATFMTGLNTAQIQSGGLSIDATTTDITIGQVLSGSGALTKTGGNKVTLTGANTYSGNTTISAGTLALGLGGSIASSPTITIATGTTLDVSAITYTLGVSQTLARNSTSGVGNVNGSVTLSSGAAVSLQVDGTAGTVGTLSVSGGLTLNGNTVTINVSGSALAVGTYPIINYTGAKTGSFNSTPVITGSGIAGGTIADLLESAGQISLRVVPSTRTWTGGGANANWSTVANWNGAAPVNGDKLLFTGSTQLANNNDISGLTVPWMTFSSGGFSISGNAVTVSGSITNSTGNNAFNGGVTLGGALGIQSDAGTLTLGGSVSGGSQNLTVDGAGNTTISGALSGTGSVTKNGAGTLTFSGTAANTLSGTTTINAGLLSLGKTAGVNALAGDVTVGDGTGGAGVDILQLGAANQIADTAAVTVSASGRFDLNGFAETVASVSSSSSASQVVLGSGTLTLGDAGATTFAGVISGTGSVVKQGTGTVTLTGANTLTGNTTISAGTLALGVGGSISSSPTISIASGATFNVSAVSYTLGAAQTLGRTSTSGAGNVSGSVTFASGSKASVQVDGSSGSVGTIAVAGNITLNSNVILINVVNAPLNVGTYTLITYTGTKTGSFNVTPTFSGSGLSMGLAAKIVETAGVISVKVYVPAHGIGGATIKVVENDLANTTNSVTVTTTFSVNGLVVRDGSSRGDYTVQSGSTGTDDVTTGVLISSVAENGKDNGETSGTNYCTSSIAVNSGGYFIPTSEAPGGTEYNINVSAAFFPYAKYLGGYARNSAGTGGGPNDLLTASSGINLGTQFVDNGSGTSTVNLTSLGVNSQTDGVLLVCGAANNNDFAASKANADGTWTIYLKDNGATGSTNTQGPVAFAFVPKTNVTVVSGKFDGNGNILMYNGTSPRFSVTNTSQGIWKLTIPGYSPSKGVLVISAEGGTGFNVDNVVSFQASGNDWLIQTRDLPGLGLQALTTEPVASFIFIPAPSATLVSPANNSTISTAPTLAVTANNVPGGNLTVTFYGHREAVPGPGEDFLLPVLPDTQNYAREAAGSGTAVKEMWFAQTDWIISHRFTDNIPFVATLGDCVQNGDGVLSEWKNATNAYYRLEDQGQTQLLDGIPYGVTVGNHDQDPNGDPDGTTTLYNQYFGSSHFSTKSYYGDHYSSNNDSWWDLFSAGGLDFIVISFEYGRYGTGVLDWAQAAIDAHPSRRIIVLTHHAGDDNADVNATTTTFSTQGQTIYDALKVNQNFFLMLGGHVFNEGGEGRRTDTFNGHTTRTLVSDYQGRFNGGNGLMRLMYFSPSNNLVSVKTYSPWTGSYETDANSQFTFTYNMQPNGNGVAGTSYAPLKTNVNVVAGTQSSFNWTGLTASRTYDWYVTIADEVGDFCTSTEWIFKTSSSYTGFAPVTDSNKNGLPDDWEAKFGVSDPNADNDGDGQSNYAEYIANTDPTKASSVLRILSTSQSNAHVTLTWASVGGIRYRIQASDNLNGTFADIVRAAADETDPSPSGTASTQSFTDTLSANSVRFYRVKVVP